MGDLAVSVQYAFFACDDRDDFISLYPGMISWGSFDANSPLDSAYGK